MEVTELIPDNFLPNAALKEDVSRQMLEADVIEKYRQGTISLGKLAVLLDMCIDEANGFLKEHNIPSNYDLEDLARDRRTLELFLKKIPA